MAFQKFYRRAFLNQRGFHAGAFVHADIAVEDGYRAGDGKRVEAYLSIADCGRAANLDFCAEDRRFARNALFKARLLKKTVDAFVEALEQAIDAADLE
jgi:hypothetical protein